MSLKVIGVGQGRTGTNSTQTALNLLGFHTYHMVEVIQNSSRGDLDLWLKLAKQKQAGQKVDLDLLRRVYALGKYDATVDAPGCWFWQELLELNPNGKFVLNVRDSKKWIESVLATIYFSHEVQESAIGTLCMRVHRLLNTPLWRMFDMTNSLFWVQFLAAENESLRTPEARARAIKYFEDFNVKDRLLVFRVEDGWAPLCKFLEVPIPDKPFPHTNDTVEFQRQTVFVRLIFFGIPLVLLLVIVFTIRFALF